MGHSKNAFISIYMTFFVQEVYGWTVAAVQKAATDLKLSPAVASIFDRPEAALVKV